MLHEFPIKDIDGSSDPLGFGAGRMTLLAFVSPTCPVCSSLLPSLRSLAETEISYLNVIMISLSGDDADNQEYRRKNALNGIRYVVSREIGERFAVLAPPYAVLAGGDGTVLAKGVVNHFEHLESLLTAARIGHASIESYVKSAGGQARMPAHAESVVSAPSS